MAKEPQDLSSIKWRMPEFITYHGGLRTDLIMEYFSLSPFYDRRSNNQVLKMQSQLMALGDIQENLSRMTGLEFTISGERVPDIWIIKKQYRMSPTEGL